jgi:hypothetical protein
VTHETEEICAALRELMDLAAKVDAGATAYHTVVVPDQAPPEVREHADVASAVAYLAQFHGKDDVKVAAFRGMRCRRTVGPFRQLITPEGTFPLFTVTASDEFESDEAAPGPAEVATAKVIDDEPEPEDEVEDDGEDDEDDDS